MILIRRTRCKDSILPFNSNLPLNIEDDFKSHTQKQMRENIPAFRGRIIKEKEATKIIRQ